MINFNKAYHIVSAFAAENQLAFGEICVEGNVLTKLLARCIINIEVPYIEDFSCLNFNIERVVS